MIKKFLCSLVALGALWSAAVADAAPIDKLRTSVSPARVRIVLDSREPIKYKLDKDGLELTIDLPQSKVAPQESKIKDVAVKSIKLQAKGRESGRLVVKLKKDCQYKVYQLQGPNRLVLDIFRISIVKQSRSLADGVTYTYLQDELNGRQIQAYLVEVKPDSAYELRPFSAAGIYNGRGSLSRQAQSRNLLAAINSSYFDTDGWVIGSTKDKGRFVSVDGQPRSGFASKAGAAGQVVPDIAYSGRLRLPNGIYLDIKGMNRVRIADDLVLYNEYYAPTTKTNAFGREIKLRGNKVIAVGTAGNMSIEPGTYVISGHGASAAALSSVRVGDRLILMESLGNDAADAAETVVSGGPLLLKGGQVNVRAAEENIAADIARGKAPRTAVGVKRDGTLQLLVVDGRSNNSAGVTLAELAQYFLRLGAVEAVNFDGGGSSEMVIKGQIVNKPSDGRERLVSMGLGIFTKQ